MAEHAPDLQRLKIYRDYELDDSGVTPVWAWVCLNAECHTKTAAKGYALFWENTRNMASHHLKNWH